VIEQTERPLDYLAILFVHALMWDGLQWSPGAPDYIRETGKSWGLSSTLVDVTFSHNHLSLIP
jgi:hypothetical protein